MTVLAKFRCTFIDEPLYLKKAREEHPEGNHDESRVIHFSAVKDEDTDNEQWSKWTPSGDIQIYVTNPAAFEQFEQGRSYLLTFEPA